MSLHTPFFKNFHRLLFGKPPVSALARSFTESSCNLKSASDLQDLYAAFIPLSLFHAFEKALRLRSRIFSLQTTFWSFLNQVQNPEISCREVVRTFIASVQSNLPPDQDLAISPSDSAYCQARLRIPLELLLKIMNHLVQLLDKRILRHQLWHGRKVRIVDGTGISMPDTPKNQEQWPQGKSQKPGCGFPSLKLVGLFCLHSGALIKAAYSSIKSNEISLFRQLMPALEPGDILVADRGFCAFGILAELSVKKVDSLLRLPEKRIRKAIGSKLPKCANFDVIVPWNKPKVCPKTMEKEEFNALPESIPVRCVAYEIKRKGCRSHRITLVTTLVDPKISTEQLADLYCLRWCVEIHFREIKTTMKMDVLRCLSPAMIERELQMHLIAYNLVRLVMQNAANIHNLPMRSLSFKGSLDSLKAYIVAMAGKKKNKKTLAAVLEEMLLCIAKDLLPDRPDRVEPRVKKRRDKSFPLMNKTRQEYKADMEQKNADSQAA